MFMDGFVLFSNVKKEQIVIVLYDDNYFFGMLFPTTGPD